MINILVLPQFVEMTCTSKNKKYLIAKGYQWIYLEKIMINVLDLTLGSGIYVNVQCDYCLENGIEKILSKHYIQYVDSIKIVQKVSCNNTLCMQKKIEDVCIVKYGVKSPMQVKEINKKSADKRRTPFEVVKGKFTEKNYILLSTEYINENTVLEYICPKHEDKGILTTNYGNIYMGHGCYWCGLEKMKCSQLGNKSHLWKGGTTQLRVYLRERLFWWKEESIKFCNGKCVISGKSKNIEVHHLYSFNSIVVDTLKELGLEDKENINGYSEEELILIENKCLEIHYRHPLGVCLDKNIHNDFHSIYGKENNTELQFNEFVNRLYSERNIKSPTVDGGKIKYFPHKLNAKSKYRNVNKIEKLNKWSAKILYKRKRIQIGCFDSEYEAAEAYNLKAIELFGKNATLNLLDENDKPDPKVKKKFYEMKSGTSSKYFGVQYVDFDSWIARMDFEGKRLYLGYFQTEWLAAEAFNDKAVELFGEDAVLNLITDEDLIKKENYIPKIKPRSSIYIGVTYVKRDSSWNAYIRHNGKRLSLGYHKNQEDAALAYNKKAIELYGNNIVLNKIKESVAI